MHIYVYTCIPYIAHVEVRGKLLGLGSPLLLCRFCGLNSSHPTLWRNFYWLNHLEGLYNVFEQGWGMGTFVRITICCDETP